jgi:hypothetical protein
MATKTREERLQTLLEKRAEIDARLERLRSLEAIQKRKLDTRKKILLGAVLLKELNQNDELRELVMEKLLPRELKAPRDRAVFGLPPLEPGP